MTQPGAGQCRRDHCQLPCNEAWAQPPIPGEPVAYLELAPLATAPHWARSQTNTALRAWRLWPETIETATLLVSEIVTNSVKATGPDPKQLKYGDLTGMPRISLTLRHLPGKVVIEVFDHNPNPPVLIDAGFDAESGRGLMLVEALSKEWGHFFPPAGGKIVYAVVGA